MSRPCKNIDVQAKGDQQFGTYLKSNEPKVLLQIYYFGSWLKNICIVEQQIEYAFRDFSST